MSFAHYRKKVAIVFLTMLAGSAFSSSPLIGTKFFFDEVLTREAAIMVLFLQLYA